MTLREWTDANPTGEMKGLRIADPKGKPWNIGTAWRVGIAEPPIIGMLLHKGDEFAGQLDFQSMPWDTWMDDWTIRE